MTKKELIESEEFRMLPDDAEIVFATDRHIRMCVPVTGLSLSILKESGKTALVIDAIPYWYLKERYGVVLSDNSKD